MRTGDNLTAFSLRQEKVTELTMTLQKMESEIRYMEDALSEKISSLKDDDIKLPQEDVVIETPKEDVLSMKDELQKQIVDHSEESDAGSISRAELNQKIIDMHNQGFSEVEIAKKLGVGLGEVKLVLGLFN